MDAEIIGRKNAILKKKKKDYFEGTSVFVIGLGNLPKEKALPNLFI